MEEIQNKSTAYNIHMYIFIYIPWNREKLTKIKSMKIIFGFEQWK